MRIASPSVALCSVLFALVSLAPGQARAQYHGDTFRCESDDHRQNFCGVDTRGGVRLVRQLSDSPCIEGRTWGWDRRGVWVTEGCRAEFSVGRGGWHGGDEHGDDGVVRCESRDHRQNYCAIDSRGGVVLVRQLSDAPCIEGRTWGSDRRGVWVSEGCRAEFAVRYSGGRYEGLPGDGPVRPGYGGPGGQVIRCESTDRRYRHCPAPIRREARLVRQLSDSDCRYNVSWGYDRNGVWVDRGCRAEFAID